MRSEGSITYSFQPLHQPLLLLVHDHVSYLYMLHDIKYNKGRVSIINHVNFSMVVGSILTTATLF
jgi:hypothetical protein